MSAGGQSPGVEMGMVLLMQSKERVRRYEFPDLHSGSVLTVSDAVQEGALPSAQVLQQSVEAERKKGFEEGRRAGYWVGHGRGYQDGQLQGWQEGQVAGYADARQSQIERGQRVFALFEQIRSEMENLHITAVRELGQPISELVTVLAERVLAHELTVSSLSVQRMVEQGLQLLPRSEQVVIHLHPHDRSCIERVLVDWPVNWKIVESDTVELGGCFLAAASGEVDASVKKRWESCLRPVLESLLADSKEARKVDAVGRSACPPPAEADRTGAQERG